MKHRVINKMMQGIIPLCGAMLLSPVVLPIFNPLPANAAPIFRVSDSRAANVLNRLEQNSDAFRKSVSWALDRSRLDDSKRAAQLNAYIGDFENAIDRLQKRFYDRRRISSDVQDVLDRGSKIDRFMPVQRRNWERANQDWERVRNSLQELARITNGNRFP